MLPSKFSKANSTLALVPELPPLAGLLPFVAERLFAVQRLDKGPSSEKAESRRKSRLQLRLYRRTGIDKFAVFLLVQRLPHFVKSLPKFLDFRAHVSFMSHSPANCSFSRWAAESPQERATASICRASNVLVPLSTWSRDLP